MKKIITSPHIQKAIEYVVAYRGSDILDFAKEQGWDDVRICGRGKMITSPVEHESGWKLFPEIMDDSIIPAAALQRVKALDDAGITYQGLIIAHEPAPAEPVEEERGDLFNKKWLKYAGTVFAVVVLSPFAVAVAGLAFVAGIAYLIYLVTNALEYIDLIDPTLILCCDDGTWIQIYDWYE
jgi:hypothetical protein